MHSMKTENKSLRSLAAEMNDEEWKQFNEATDGKGIKKVYFVRCAILEKLAREKAKEFDE